MSLTRRLLGTAAATFDRAVVRAIQLRNARIRKPAEALSHDDRLTRLALIEQAYAADPATYFAPPRAIDPELRRPREASRGRARDVVVHDASWASLYEPYLDGIRAPYAAHAKNQVAHARLFLGSGSERRPAVVLIHGYMAGQWSVEERAWPIEWLSRIGLDVAIAILPFHAVRGDPDRGAPPFPGADPRFTNEGFRQAMADLRALIGFLRARGAPVVGAMGMSLGGYTTSLLATVETDLGFAVPIIPLASIADFARDQGSLGTPAQALLQHRALESANRIVSPLARPSVIAKDRILVVGADADRITPVSHAERLARHFDARMVRIHGGHLLQFGRGDAFREVAKMLRHHGVIAAATAR